MKIERWGWVNDVKKTDTASGHLFCSTVKISDENRSMLLVEEELSNEFDCTANMYVLLLC